MLEEHKCLVEAIAARDVEAAQRAAREHLGNAEQTLLKEIAEIAENNED